VTNDNILESVKKLFEETNRLYYQTEENFGNLETNQLVETMTHQQPADTNKILTDEMKTLTQVVKGIAQSYALPFIRKLDDSNNDVTKFLADYDRITTAIGWSDDEKITRLPTYLGKYQNEVYHYNYDKFIMTPPGTTVLIKWETFAERLAEHLDGKTPTEKYQVKFLLEKQNISETIDEYFHRMVT
jgi:hypothetical protein